MIFWNTYFLQGLKDQALAEPDKDEALKWEKGVIRGKVFVPKVEEVITKEYDSDDEEPVKVESNSLNYDDEYGWGDGYSVDTKFILNVLIKFQTF